MSGKFEKYAASLHVGLRPSLGLLPTITDRKIPFVTTEKIPRPKARIVHQVTVKELKGHIVRSLTNDDGVEFIPFRGTSRALRAPIFSTRPYASWERGSVENRNKLIRQYFPKSIDLKEIPDEKIKMVELVLNHRPRKILGFMNPAMSKPT